ncbi:MAG TPA: glutathione S-transferase family protein [Rhizomicrobium sp.]
MAKYTLILGTKNWSSWSLRPWLALCATGHPFEEVVIGLNQPQTHAEILKHSPSGKVPALRIEQDGRAATVFDSLAICETLAERHPEARLWPSDPTARAQARSVSAVMHSGFAELRTTLSMDFARKLSTPPLTETVKGQIAEIIAYWQAALERYGRDGFLFGEFSVADCMYAPVVSRFRTYAIALPPALDAYSARMFQLPAMRQWEAASRAEIAAGVAGPRSA